MNLIKRRNADWLSKSFLMLNSVSTMPVPPRTCSLLELELCDVFFHCDGSLVWKTYTWFVDTMLVSLTLHLFGSLAYLGETGCPACERERSLAVGGCCAGSLALPAWLGCWIRPYGRRTRSGILDLGRSVVTAKSGLRA